MTASLTHGTPRGSLLTQRARLTSIQALQGLTVDVTAGIDIDAGAGITLDAVTSIALTSTTTFDIAATTAATITASTTFDVAATGKILISSTSALGGGSSAIQIDCANGHLVMGGDEGTLSVANTLTLGGSDYALTVGGNHTVDGNTAQNDAAAQAAGVYHGHITSLDALANSDANVAAIWLYSA